MQVWINSPQRAAIAIDRLMGMRFVQGSTIIRWVFASRGMKSVDDELAKGLAWEALVNCTNKMIARAGDEREDIGLLQAELDKAREAAEKAEQAVGEATMMEGSAVESRLSMLQERQVCPSHPQMLLIATLVAAAEGDQTAI